MGPELIGLDPWPLAVRGGLTLDGGAFDVDARIIPLREGQRDWETLVEVGHSFHPRSLWTMGWVGYRRRLENTQAGPEPGNKIFWWWSPGGETEPLG